jgi:putative Flp pilus-assembly TadE/G-like protein
MIPKYTEKGQALIIIALAAVVLFGFAALAIDGSTAFSDRRHAQNAADTAAMAGALAFTRGSNDSAITTTAKARASNNSYTENGTTKLVTVNITNLSHGECPGKALGKDIEVQITSVVNTTFARILGRTQLTNVVRATARGCGYIVAPLFPGNAIVSLSDRQTVHGGHLNDCGFSSSGSTTLNVVGGGIFSNGCASNEGHGSVNLDAGECVNTVGVSAGFTCQNPGTQNIDYPNGVLAMMPPNPCDHTVGDVGIQPSPGQTTFTNGVYCISDMDAFDKKNIVLHNATLYVTDTNFNLMFAGSGGFSGDPTQEGTYSNYYMIIAMTNPPCPSFTSQNSQVINYRGNGSGALQGTILAPSACIDLRGNGQTANTINSQVIGYNVSANGDADVTIEYKQDENHRDPYVPFITLLK